MKTAEYSACATYADYCVLNFCISCFETCPRLERLNTEFQDDQLRRFVYIDTTDKHRLDTQSARLCPCSGSPLIRVVLYQDTCHRKTTSIKNYLSMMSCSNVILAAMDSYNVFLGPDRVSLHIDVKLKLMTPLY